MPIRNIASRLWFTTDNTCGRDFALTTSYIDAKENMNIKELFEQRKNNPVWNTSYPIRPADWIPYRADGPLSFASDKGLSLYIHIPFCKRLCSFCEYTRMVCPDEEMQSQYIRTIDKEVSTFVSIHPTVVLRGFDIGGGTPTALSDKNLNLLLQTFREVQDWLDVSTDFEPSIEATFDSITESKATLIAGAGIHRMSIGIQSTDNDVLKANHRNCIDIETMKCTMQMLHENGIRKINLDMMYGLKGQTPDTLQKDLQTLCSLNPEQVTLYELRTNMIHESAHMSKEELYGAYTTLYDGLTAMGYHARFGQNTFSKNVCDMGVSSYLRSRMLEGVAYKGFGISAQSMSSQGVAYNVGKQSGAMHMLIGKGSFSEEFTYALPPHELASKYIAIGAYSGSFSLHRLTQILGRDANDYYKKQLDFCLAEGYVEILEDRVYVTPNGFKYYGALFSLFHSLESK
jgi:oxygen-independent coproporphyrinogen III oxidase